MPIGLDPGGGGGGPPADVDEPDRAPDIVWERWLTREDGRVCPECGPLDGYLWPQGSGPQPPLHDHCRCERVFDHVERGTN